MIYICHIQQSLECKMFVGCFIASTSLMEHSSFFLFLCSLYSFFLVQARSLCKPTILGPFQCPSHWFWSMLWIAFASSLLFCKMLIVLHLGLLFHWGVGLNCWSFLNKPLFATWIHLPLSLFQWKSWLSSCKKRVVINIITYLGAMASHLSFYF